MIRPHHTCSTAGQPGAAAERRSDDFAEGSNADPPTCPVISPACIPTPSASLSDRLPPIQQHHHRQHHHQQHQQQHQHHQHHRQPEESFDQVLAAVVAVLANPTANSALEAATDAYTTQKAVTKALDSVLGASPARAPQLRTGGLSKYTHKNTHTKSIKHTCDSIPASQWHT